MAGLRSLSTYAAAIAVLAYTVQCGTERIRMLSLRDRLTRFFDAPPASRDAASYKTIDDLDRLIAQYSDEEALESALKAKYGASLPAEAVHNLGLEDWVGVGAYRLRRKTAPFVKTAAVYLDRVLPLEKLQLSAWLERECGKMMTAVRRSPVVKRWSSFNKHQQLGFVTVSAGVMRLALPEVARMPILLLWTAVAAAGVQPTPADFSPSVLREQMSAAWGDSATAPSWQRLMHRRLALVAASGLTSLALVSARHAPPLLSACCIVAAIAANPPLKGSYEEMSFVHPDARHSFKLSLRAAEMDNARDSARDRPSAVRTHDLCLFSVVTLNDRRAQSGMSDWLAPVLALGFGGEWHAVGRVVLDPADASKKLLTVRGPRVLSVPPPLYALPALLVAVALIATLLAGGEAPSKRAKLASRLLVLLCLATASFSLWKLHEMA
uniref:Uncharacterized protein n=1 Tax=Chrysotila carterae TaxID=13221 RepID=A0A7S4FAA6_CHRCT